MNTDPERYLRALAVAHDISARASAAGAACADLQAGATFHRNELARVRQAQVLARRSAALYASLAERADVRQAIEAADFEAAEHEVALRAIDAAYTATRDEHQRLLRQRDGTRAVIDAMRRQILAERRLPSANCDVTHQYTAMKGMR